MITFPAPMHAPEQIVEAFSSPDWIYELKHDGVPLHGPGRARDAGDPIRVQLRTKTGANCTAWFPEIARGLAALPRGPHIIDGEACVLREDGFQPAARARPQVPRIRATAVLGQIVLRRLTASTIRVARLVDVHGIDQIPALRSPLIKRWERDGLLLHGESTADEWRGDWRPQAWWCEPAQEGAPEGGWAKWYRWRRPVPQSRR